MVASYAASRPAAAARFSVAANTQAACIQHTASHEAALIMSLVSSIDYWWQAVWVKPKQLMMLALVKSHFGTLVCTQLCNLEGVSLSSFVRLPSRVSCPLAGAAVYGMSLTHAERLCVVGCGFKGKLVRLLSLGEGRHFQPQRNWNTCRTMMQVIVRRVAAGQAAAVRDKAAKEAAELCASGNCAAALVPLQRAIDFGDTTSLALKAWLLILRREGVARDPDTACELAKEGTRLGCHHCQGVLACCYFFGFVDKTIYNEVRTSELARMSAGRALDLARVSAGKGSRYGQYTLALLHDRSRGKITRDVAKAVAFYQLASAQGLDAAQCELGNTLIRGRVVARNYAEGLRLCHLSAAQGYTRAFNSIAECHESGWGVAADASEAIRWYRRAEAAGDYDAAD